MTISILGAGWLGAPLGASLVSKGHKVFGSTTRSAKTAEIEQLGIKAFVINLDEQEPLPKSFFQSDVLIITIPPGRRNPNVLEDFPKRIIKIIQASQEETIKKIIYTSSTGVYGEVEGIVTEESALQPVTNSAKAVLDAEQLLGAQSIPLTVLRFGGLTGGNRQAGRFFAGRRNIPNGNAPVNFVHREDCIGVIEQIIEKNVWGEVFNVCATEHPLKKDFYPVQAQKLGLEAPTFTEEKTQAYKIVSNNKVRSVLGYSFIHPDPMSFS